MWIPESAEQIEQAAANGDLVETASFDGKEALPPKKNIDLAIDVAAMATDGGVLLYGVGEDDDERLTRLCPFRLAGAVERIGNIVQSSIAEVPFVDVREYELATRPGTGYLVLVVPASARAPHQVIVGADFRFYGRGPKGNRRLTEGEIARLYERRGQWQVNRQERLQEVISFAPYSPDDDLGFLHAFCQPIPPNRALWRQAIDGHDRSKLLGELHAAARSIAVGEGGVPMLTSSAADWRQQGADVWRLAYSHQADRRVAFGDLNIDGRGQLFLGRAADRDHAPYQPPSESRPLVIREELVIGNLAAFFSMMAAFYRSAAYVGPVDVGLALTGMNGAFSSIRRLAFADKEDAFNSDSYSRDDRLDIRELDDAPAVTMRMLRDFLDATAGERYDPFKEPSR